MGYSICTASFKNNHTNAMPLKENLFHHKSEIRICIIPLFADLEKRDCKV